MTSDPPSTPGTTDRDAIISFVAGQLTLLAVCMAIIPVPFTGYVCFPAAAVLTVAAVVCGIRALRGESQLSAAHRAMAIAGIGASAVGVLIAACSAAAMVLLGVRLVEAIFPQAP